jgi:hypothetical protein
MAHETIDYEAVLVDLEAKRAALDAAIAALRQVMSLGASTASPFAPGQSARQVDPANIPDDAFFGLSIGEAAKKYLTIVKRKQSVREIADALERGGLPHTSSDFVNTVGTMLGRYSKVDSEMVRVGRGDWGLASWYGNRRPKVEPVKKGKAKRAKRDGRARASKPKLLTAARSAVDGGGLLDHAEAVLREHGSALDIADLLKRVGERAGRDVAKTTLVGMLSKKVREQDTFSRPSPGTYGLIGESPVH